MDQLEGRGAVVIGGGSGIGRGIALALAAEGMRVLVADIDGDSAGAVRAEITGRGGDAHAAQVDATDREALAELAAATRDELHRGHVLVNTVGVLTDASVTTSGDNVWAWYVDFHLMSAVRVVATFLPLLRAHDDGGHIVLTSSMAGLLTLPVEQTGGVNTGVYTVLKHAIVAYGDMLRHEMASDGIAVSVLCPGSVNTNLNRTSARHRPERFGGPLPEPPAREGPPPMAFMEPEELGPIVVSGLRANSAYILPDPAWAEAVRGRQQQLLDDFAFYAQMLHG